MGAKNERNNMEEVCDNLDLANIINRDISLLSGGELQRFAIGIVCVQEADVYMFDEPSSYLDIKQRLKAAREIRKVIHAREGEKQMYVLFRRCDLMISYVICVEHDLSVLDYLSDFICVLYGTPGAYGVVSMPFSVREGINIFLAGWIPTENLRFRDWALNFKVYPSFLLLFL